MFAAPVYLFVKSDIPGLSNFPSSSLDEMRRYVVVSNLKWLFEFFWECFSIRWSGFVKINTFSKLLKKMSLPKDPKSLPTDTKLFQITILFSEENVLTGKKK